MWVQPNLLVAHFFILKPIRATACSFFKLKTCGAGQRFFFLESRKGGELGVFFWSKNRLAVCCFFWSRKQGVLGDFSGAENRACWAIFFWSRKFAAAVLFAAKILFSQFFRQSERLICAVAVKGNFLRIVFG